MSIIDKFIKADPYARHLGVEVLEASKGYAKAKLAIRAHHLNSAGTVHGGVIFSLADVVFSVSSNSHGTLAMAVNASISFFKAVSRGVLYAEAKEVSLNPRLATYLISVRNDNGEKIALFQGMVYRKKTTLKDLLNKKSSTTA